MKKLQSISAFLGIAILVVGVVAGVLPAHKTYAAGLTSRSLTLEAGSVLGGSAPSDGNPAHTVKHLFNFTTDFANLAEDVGSVTFQYCTTGEPVTGGIGCYAPDGLDVSTAALSTDGGDVTGFTGLTTSANEDAADPNNGNINTITITAASAVHITTASALTKEFSGIVNPSTANQTFYVRISVFSSTDASGTATDTGTVAASTANPIVLTGTMPESLVFCSGQSISETNNVPDCATATPGNIGFNQLFSSTTTAWATSQMAASTNAGTGYAITVNGTTLSSGSDTITAINTAGGDLSTPGTSQFGMNVAADDEANAATPAITPASAAVTSPTGNSFYHAEAVAPYATGGDATTAKYAYVSGDTVADSTSQASDPQVFTATYMVNVPGHQPAGTYATTLTYICTATF